MPMVSVPAPTAKNPNRVKRVWKSTRRLRREGSRESVSVSVSGGETAADILRKSEGISHKTGLSEREVQKQIALASIKQAERSRGRGGGDFFTPAALTAQSIDPTIPRAEQSLSIAPPTRQGQQVTKGFSERPGFGIKEEVFQTTLKKGAKSATIFESKSFATKDFDELSAYEKADVAVGGVLPGGVSREFAANIRAKERLMATKREAELIRKRDAWLKATAVVGGVQAAGAAAVTFVPLGVTALKGLVTAKGATTAVGAAAGISAVGVGTHEVFIQQEKLTRTKTQKQIAKDFSSEIKKAVGAGKKSISEVDFRISDPNLIKRTGLFTAKGGVRERAFEFGARQSLIESGLTGGKLEEAVAIAQRKRMANIMGTIAGTVTIGAGSEIGGRIGLRGVKQQISTVAARKIGRLGFAEGAAMNVLSTKAGHTDITFINNPATWAVGGAFTAGAIGGKIAGLGEGVKGKGILGAAYVTDVGEAFGDFAADVGSVIFKGTKKVAGIKPAVITMTSIPPLFERGKTRKQTIRKARFAEGVKPKTQPPIKTTTTISKRDVSISKRPTFIDVKIKVPTITAVTVPKTTKGGRVTTFTPTTPTTIRTPTAVDVPIRTPVPTVVDIPSFVPATVPPVIPPFVPTAVDVPTVVDVPTAVTVPTFKIPFFIPGGGGAGRKFPRLFGTGKIRSRYAPSLAAKIYKIKAKKKPKIVTGLGVRPLVGGF